VCGQRFDGSRFLVTRGCRYRVTDAGSPHGHGTRIGRVTGFLAMCLTPSSRRLEGNPREVIEALGVLRHDARRQRTGNRNELLALEQAIVDRELIELVTGGRCDKESELAGDRVRKRDVPAATRGHGSAL
jgi:hypothetical protein